MSKKIILIISLVGALFFLGLLFAAQLGICALDNYSCTETLNPIAQDISIFFPLLLLSLLTYKMREEVYRVWLRFALWWAPLSVVVTLITPTTHDWLYPLASKGGVAFLSAVFFFFGSLLVIAWKYFATRRDTH